MILHRLRLTNFRGVADREIAFPDNGVAVVCGPNEVGKSSMLEALDLLLTYRDRSGHRDVKRVKPTHADVGAEVEAEISTGAYRFVYRKRFHKKCETHLRLLAPSRSDLDGDEAHDRVTAMIEETVDVRLWEAQRVLQSAVTADVDLSGCDALSRALDVAAGEAAEATGAESLLVDRIDAEYARYFTGTGRPTGIWKDTIAGLAEAQARAEACAARVAEVEERVNRHEELSLALQELTASVEPAACRLAAARAAADGLAELAAGVDEARLQAQAAQARSAQSAAALDHRGQLVAGEQRRAADLEQARALLEPARQRLVLAEAARDAAVSAAAQAEAALGEAQRRQDTARAAHRVCLARDEVGRLAGRLELIDGTARNLAGLDAELAGLTPDPDALAAIENAAAQVSSLQSRRDAAAGTVEFIAASGVRLTVDGEPFTLPAGQSLARPVSAELSVEVPGVLTVRVDPGAGVAELQSQLASAEEALSRALEAAGVADLSAARAAGTRRAELVHDRATMAATLEGLRAGEDPEQLRTRLAEFTATLETATRENGALETGAEETARDAAAELDAATEAVDLARAAAEVARAGAEAAAAALGEAATEVTVLSIRAENAGAELAESTAQLAARRAEATDDEVAGAAAADADLLRQAEGVSAELTARYRAAQPEAVQAELEAAQAASESVRARRDDTERELNRITAELGVIGGEGRHGKLAEAQAALADAQAEHDRIGARAEAAMLLRDTMNRHRDNTRQRYVQPYRSELERLGRIVFGQSFEVEVDTTLAIRTRTLEGCTVPYESLSGGAREQLGILARLAGAALVAEEDSVPVLIDDALGFTDPDRLIRMGEVFNAVGDRGQVIVLTCQPDRYAGIDGASVIELSA